MENRDDLNSILPYLPPLSLNSSGLSWSPEIVEKLTNLSLGPYQSGVTSGRHLYLVISSLRQSISLDETLASNTADGYSFFFDEQISTDGSDEPAKWLKDVVPAMATLVLRLPSLLETHYQNTDVLSDCTGERGIFIKGLSVFKPKKEGIVFLSQELIGAFIGCSFFCLFSNYGRGSNEKLQRVNFDYMFANISSFENQNVVQKLRCIMNYFQMICSSMPTGMVSFERKVFPEFGYPEDDYWTNSLLPLCEFKGYQFGRIEDRYYGALEVVFANWSAFGGGALRFGCLQEEIRFMINPELIAGMIFLPPMSYNEAIEIVGAERFSSYIGYDDGFRFLGDYEDYRDLDLMGRRKTRIIAMDASIYAPGIEQYKLTSLLREVNKAFIGFQDGFRYQQYQRLHEFLSINKDPYAPNVASISSGAQMKGKGKILENDEPMGVVTGNWGCGPNGGDPDIKLALQWIAASQAKRSFIIYYTVGLLTMEHIKEIMSKDWTVGDFWRKLVEYSFLSSSVNPLPNFFTWLLSPPQSH